MTIRVAINGYGRMGRNILRALYESNRPENSNQRSTTWAMPMQRTPDDVRHGTRTFSGRHFGGRRLARQRRPDTCLGGPVKLPGAISRRRVHECTGLFIKSRHPPTSKRGRVSSPPSAGNVATVVYGVNRDKLKAATR